MDARTRLKRAIKTLIPWVNTIWNRGSERFGRELSYFKFPDCGLAPSLEIAPSKIITMNRMTVKDVNTSSLFFGGDWMPWNVPLATYRDRNWRYVACKQVLVERADIRETAEFEYLVNSLNKNGKARNLRSEEAIERYLLGIQEMYFTIERTGKVNTQYEMFGIKFGEEISFAIDHDQELVKVDGGHHRFAAALTLGLPVVPGQVRKIHSDCIPYIQRRHGNGAGGVRSFILDVIARYQ